jgi:predicted enzyme related to lactoylglutathione lyase
VLEEDIDAVKYEAGGVILALNRASDFGVKLYNPDDSSLLTFLVDNINETQAALMAGGVVFGPTLRYEIGATTSFFDTDGHCYTLYEPSREAMTWPSANKIREILGEHHTFRGQRQTISTQRGSLNLGEQKMVYLFLFVRDADEAINFYHKSLGLPILEEDPEAGVIKYDAGGIILATHLVGGDAYCAVDLDLDHPKGKAPVFHVTDIQQTYQDLSLHGVPFSSRIVQSEIGSTASFEDPNGHRFFIYEPSKTALSWPSGVKIQKLLSNSF